MPNHWTKSKETGIPYVLKDSTRKKLSEAAKTSNETRWTKEFREKHSEKMKEAVKKYPESYTSSNRGRTKQIVVDGVKFQGKWELEFYQYCVENKINIKKSNEYFEYEWNGTRKYFPDFYLPDLDLYIEVKGYETERDRAKWTNFPKKLKIIRKEDIIQIRKKCFSGL